MTQGKRQVNVWLDDETYHRLKVSADANERTVGAEVRVAVRAWMASEPCPTPGCQFEASHLNEHPCGTHVPTVGVSAEDRAAKAALAEALLREGIVVSTWTTPQIPMAEWRP